MNHVIPNECALCYVDTLAQLQAIASGHNVPYSIQVEKVGIPSTRYICVAQGCAYIFDAKQG